MGRVKDDTYIDPPASLGKDHCAPAPYLRAPDILSLGCYPFIFDNFVDPAACGHFVLMGGSFHEEA